jgi:hypothetical protein
MQDQDKLKEYLAKIPQNIKDIMYSLDYQKLLEEIVKKNGLMINQAGGLEVETTLVLAGLSPLREYVDNLKKALEISREKAEEIAKDVDNFIFKNIRKSLQELNEEDDKIEYVIEQKAKEELNKEKLLFGIENPNKIEEDSISVSSLGSQSRLETFSNGIEVNKGQGSEIPKEAIVQQSRNTSPVEKIVETKTSEPVVLQKENVIIEEKIKLPNKIDPYREQA